MRYPPAKGTNQSTFLSYEKFELYGSAELSKIQKQRQGVRLLTPGGVILVICTLRIEAAAIRNCLHNAILLAVKVELEGITR